jgi:Globin
MIYLDVEPGQDSLVVVIDVFPRAYALFHKILRSIFILENIDSLSCATMKNSVTKISQQAAASVGTQSKRRQESKLLKTRKMDCTKEVSTDEIDYQMVNAVITSWDRKIMQIPNWSRVLGDRFLRHVFRIEPTTTSVFGFPPETKWDDPTLTTDEKFVQKGMKLVKAIDMAIVYLGPDLELLKEELYRLGWEHTAMKALPSHWPIVGEALLSSLEDCMIGGISDVERKAWIKVRMPQHAFQLSGNEIKLTKFRYFLVTTDLPLYGISYDQGIDCSLQGIWNVRGYS